MPFMLDALNAPAAPPAEIRREDYRPPEWQVPEIALDSLGMLAGDVVYARDFGARNALLHDRFPERTWYVARPEMRGDTVAMLVEPYTRSARR